MAEIKIVHFVLLEPAHSDLSLIFECQVCKTKHGTEAMLPHAIISHKAEKVTVDTATAMRRRSEPQNPPSNSFP